jgi:hypothetical protein
LIKNNFLQGSNAGALIVDGLEEGMEDEKIYRKLAKHLDNLPGGFPATESGVELRILRRLFSPEEAELATHLTLIPEEARVIGRRAKRPASETAARLDQMARKGLIFNIVPKKGPALYTAAQFVIGIWEYHVNDLDPELIRDMNEYIPALVAPWEKSPQLRTIPVGSKHRSGDEHPFLRDGGGAHFRAKALPGGALHLSEGAQDCGQGL